MNKINKYHLINKVLTADLKPILGKMLVEFIMRADENGFSHVGAERLCQVRGIKHTKNFPWDELHALSDVLTIKKGKSLTAAEVEQIEATGKTVYGDKNYFWIKPQAILALSDAQVVKSVKPKASERIKAKTPANAGSKTPASAEPTTLQVQTKTPANAGCNSTSTKLQEETTKESTSKAPAGAVANEVSPSNKEVTEPLNSSLSKETASSSSNSLKDKSRRLMQEQMQAVKAKQDAGRAHLETMIVKEGLEPQDAERARALYADAEFRSGYKPVQRAAAAVFKSMPVAAAPVAKKEEVGDEW